MNLIFCVIWCYLWLSSSAYNSSTIQLAGKEKQNVTLLSHTDQHNIVKNRWFVQELDHFNYADTRTWKQVFLLRFTSFYITNN